MELRSFEQMGVDFQSALKEFIEKTDGLKKNELHRVCKALAADPLEDTLIALRTSDEEEAFKVGKEIQSIKLNMMVESLRQDAEEQRVKNAQTERASKE